jgi:GNAT superfamily N-acetyltransferase
MGIAMFESHDSAAFLSLARGEGWICDQWELDFLLGSFPQGCFVWKEQGVPIAFITGTNYGESGWIGNLIVAPLFRGKGIGMKLMRESLASLEKTGVKTVWLTASLQGEPLYAKLGFSVVDTVCRWRGSGAIAPPSPALPDSATVMSIDRAGWGDSREAALAKLADRGTLFAEEEGFLICHPCGDGLQLGPWGSRSTAAAIRLLERALSSSANWVPLFLDVPQQNRVATELLGALGFVKTGSTQLMCRGRTPDYNPDMIYALASMGSFG